LVELLAGLLRLVSNILADIRVDYVIEEVIVLSGVEIVVLREFVQEGLFFIIDGLVIDRDVSLRKFTFDQSRPIRIDKLPREVR